MMSFSSASVPVQFQTSSNSRVSRTEITSDTPKTYEEWLAEIDQEIEDMKVDKSKLLAKTMEGYERFNGSDDTEILWRVARNLYRLSNLAEANGRKDDEKNFLIEAEGYIKKALAMNSENSIHHAWAAYISGKLSYFVGLKERIQRGHDVQNHCEEAIRLGTTDAGVYLTYGRLYMEAATLTWIERKLATIIFSKPPEATYQDALDKFMKADEYEPNWKVNYFYIGKAHIAMKNFEQGIKALDIAIKCVPINGEDLTIQNELSSLQRKYSSYRRSTND